MPSQKRIGKKHPNLLATLGNPEGFIIPKDEGKVRLVINSKTTLMVSPDKVAETKAKYNIL